MKDKMIPVLIPVNSSASQHHIIIGNQTFIICNLPKEAGTAADDIYEPLMVDLRLSAALCPKYITL